MANISFDKDTIARRTIHYLLYLELFVFTIASLLIIFGLSNIAFFIAIIVTLIFVTIVLWLFFRYRSISEVKEKINH